MTGVKVNPITYLCHLQHKFMQPLFPGSDEFRGKIVSQETLAGQFESVGFKEFLLELIVKLTKFIVPAESSINTVGARVIHKGITVWNCAFQLHIWMSCNFG